MSGVVLLLVAALSGAAWLVLRDPAPLFASFLFLDGSEEWAPVDIKRSIDAIEALQEMEQGRLQNMILELDREPHSTPTDDELESLWQLYRAAFEAAKEGGWFDYDRAMTAGFHDDPTDPNHYPNERNLADDEVLVPSKPEFLMFYPDPRNLQEQILVGVMFQQSGFDAHGEQIGGSAARWHKHIYGSPVCFDSSMVPHGMHGQLQCDGVPSSQSPEMLHVWFVDHPKSQFASEMSVSGDLIQPPVLMTRDAFMEKQRRLAARR
jgi:hypothetical protein